MSPELFWICVVTFASWGIAVAIKAGRALANHAPYEFAQWDGGWLRKGKRIDKLGQQIKVVTGSIIAIGCIALAIGLVPTTPGTYGLVFVALVGFVADFVTEEQLH